MAGTIWCSKCHVYVDSGSAGTALLPLRILAKLARILPYKKSIPSWDDFRKTDRLCCKLQQSQPEKPGNDGQTFCNIFCPSWAEVSGKTVPNLGIVFEAATSRQLVGKLEDDCFGNAFQVGTHFCQCYAHGNEEILLPTCDHDGHKFRG